MELKTNLDKVLHRLYLHARKNNNPLAVDVVKLGVELGMTPDAVSSSLKILQQKGKIARTDFLGNHQAPRTKGELRLLQLLIQHNGKLDWDKPAKLKWARVLGVRFTCMRIFQTRIKDLVHVEKDENGHPIQLLLIDECAALLELDDEVLVKTSDRQHYYYKYITGFRRPRKPKVEQLPPPPKKQWKHRILEYILASEGRVYGRGCDHANRLNLNRSHYEKIVNGLVACGCVTKTLGYIEIRDPQMAASFLAPFTVLPAKKSGAADFLSPRLLSGNSESRTDAVTNVTASLSPNPQKSKAVRLSGILLSLIVRKKIECEIARRLLRYPKNYEKGQEVIQSMYRQMHTIDEEMDEARRQAYGRLMGQQEGLCRRLLSGITDHLELGGLVGDALVKETVRHSQGYLPTLESPEIDTVDQLCDWIEAALPVDGWQADTVKLFINLSKSEFISEFVCRGGIDLMLRLMEWQNAEGGIIDQRIAWDVCAYMAYIGDHPFDPRKPDLFPTINSWDGIRTDSSFWTGISVAKGLDAYMDMGGKINSISIIMPRICKALYDTYPVRTAENEVVFTSAWAEMEDELSIHNEFSALQSWMEREQSKPEAQLTTEIAKYTVQWYEQKIKDVEPFGLPGDVEQLYEKVSALRRWPLVKFEEQRDHLVPVLNRPSRYESPRLNWAEWNRRVEASQKGITREWTLRQDDDDYGYDDD